MYTHVSSKQAQVLALIHECENISFKVPFRKNFAVLKCSVHHLGFPETTLTGPAANTQRRVCGATTAPALSGRGAGPAP